MHDARVRRLSQQAAWMARHVVPDWDRIMDRLPDEALEQIASCRPDQLIGVLAHWLAWWAAERVRLLADMPDNVVERIAGANDPAYASRLFWDWFDGDDGYGQIDDL